MDRWITDSAIQPSFMISLDPVWSGPYAYGLPACNFGGEEEDGRTRLKPRQASLRSLARPRPWTTTTTTTSRHAASCAQQTWRPWPSVTVMDA